MDNKNYSEENEKRNKLSIRILIYLPIILVICLFFFWGNLNEVGFADIYTTIVIVVSLLTCFISAILVFKSTEKKASNYYLLAVFVNLFIAAFSFIMYGPIYN